VCYRVVRSCGAERSRFCADASGHANPTFPTAGSARPWSPIWRDACRNNSRDCCAVRTAQYDRASDHNGFCEASADAAKTQCHSPSSGDGARTRATRACAAVALPDWWS
jgi:hypothetical protein